MIRMCTTLWFVIILVIGVELPLYKETLHACGTNCELIPCAVKNGQLQMGAMMHTLVIGVL